MYVCRNTHTYTHSAVTQTKFKEVPYPRKGLFLYDACMLLSIT